MNSVNTIIVKHRHGLVTDCHHLPIVPIVPQSAPMVSVADVSVKLYTGPLQLDSGGLAFGSKCRLDRVLYCATHLIGRIPKYASVSGYMHDVLHWLPIAQCISYKLAVLVWQCLLGNAPASSVDRYLVYMGGEQCFVPLLLASYWYLVLQLQLGSIVHPPMLVPPPGMDSLWKSASCLKNNESEFCRLQDSIVLFPPQAP